MTAPRPLPSQDQLRALFDYDEHTGYLTWRLRDTLNPGFNGRFAGKRAGAVSGRQWAVMVDYRRLGYHRVIWKWVHDTEPPEIDHINGNTSDNRLVNLRAGTRLLNAKNRGPTRGRVLPKGVVKPPKANVYRATIRLDGRYRVLGFFKTIEEASAAYQRAAKEHWGEWARAS
jgi:hypothetical protein